MSSAAVAADTRPCLSEGEAADLTVLLLPPLVTGVALRCAPVLGTGAFLIRRSATLAASYRPAADAAWPRVREAAERLGSAQLGSFLSEDVERTVVEQAATAAIVANIASKDCGMASDFAETAAPLPPRNIGRLIALALRTKLASGMPFRICAGREGQ